MKPWYQKASDDVFQKQNSKFYFHVNRVITLTRKEEPPTLPPQRTRHINTRKTAESVEQTKARRMMKVQNRWSLSTVKNRNIGTPVLKVQNIGTLVLKVQNIGTPVLKVQNIGTLVLKVQNIGTPVLKVQNIGTPVLKSKIFGHQC